MMTLRRASSLIGLTLLFVLGLSGFVQAQTLISMSTVILPPGGVTRVNIQISNQLAFLTGPVCEVQLGTSLSTPGITYTVAPGLRVVNVVDVDGSGGWNPLVFFNDTSGGNLVIEVVHTGSPTTTDQPVVAIDVRADDQQGAPLPVISVLDMTTNIANIFIRDCNGTPAAFGVGNVTNGTVQIVPFGDIDNNGTVNGADVLMVARCTVGLAVLSAEQKQIADVAAPRQAPLTATTFTSGPCVTGTNPDINDANAIALASLGMIQLPVVSEPPVVVPTIVNRFDSLTTIEHKTVLISAKRVPKPGLAGVQGSLKFDPTKMQINSVSGVNGFMVLAQHIDNEAGVVKFVAASTQKDGLSKGNILQLDVTTNGAKSPPMRLSMQSFDTEGNPIKGKTAFALKTIKNGMGALKIHHIRLLANPVRRADEAHFTVMGQGIEGVRLEIFELSGAKLFDSGFNAGDGVAWPLHTYNKPVANGVYLAVISVRGRGGEIFRSEMRKLVVLR